jgi:uncharacterized membrane protein YhaH (DUF805 family)
MAIPKINLFGRINRATFWTLYVAQGLVLFALLMLHFVAPFSDVLLALIAAPRLRDVGRSGWWAAVVLVPDLLVSGFVFPTLPREERLTAFILLGLIANGLFVVLGAWPGQSGANRFGDRPPAGLTNPFGRPVAAVKRQSAGEARPTARPRIIISGRANRATYLAWLTALLVLIIILIVMGVSLANNLILCLEALAIAISAPRLRDLGRSGWWAFGVFLADFLIIVVAVYLDSVHKLSSWASQVIAAAVIILTPVVPLVLLAAWKGDPAPNKFGNPPPPGVVNLFGRSPPTETEIADTFA